MMRSCWSGVSPVSCRLAASALSSSALVVMYRRISSTARAATLALPCTTDWRVPLRSERIDTTPYAMSGTTAASASSRAKRVAIWRFRVAIASSFGSPSALPQPASTGGASPARRARLQAGEPRTGGSRRGRARPRPGRWPADRRRWPAGRPRTPSRYSSSDAAWRTRSSAASMARAVDGLRRRAAPRVPAPVRTEQARAADGVDQHRLEAGCLRAALSELILRDLLDVHVDAGRGQLALHGQGDTLVDRVGRDEAREREVPVRQMRRELRVERELGRVAAERPVPGRHRAGRRERRGRSGRRARARRGRSRRSVRVSDPAIGRQDPDRK